MAEPPHLPCDFHVDRILSETFIAHVDYHCQLESTNSRALAMVDQGLAAEPTLVLTDRQTAGRGRGANLWWSAAGSLTFSVIIPAPMLQLSTGQWPQLSLVAGLAVCEALSLELTGLQPRLKWPNDVYLDQRKLSGILVETCRGTVPMFVVGIGINVNNSMNDAPPELRVSAVSLIDVAMQSLDRTRILVAVLRQLQAQFRRLETDRAGLLQSWRRLCLLRGRNVRLEAANRQVVGLCHGIDDEGALLLQTGSGLQRFFAGVVQEFS